MKIRVPATSANLGPGFDSCGIALSAYLTINVLGESEFWEIQHTLGEEISTNEENLLIQTALKIAPELTPKVIRMVSDIPLARVFHLFTLQDQCCHQRGHQLIRLVSQLLLHLKEKKRESRI